LNTAAPPPTLAILGGAPVFAKPRHVGTPFIPPRDLLHASLDDILDRRWLTNNGPFVAELEDLLAKRHGVTHAVAICNATIALQLLYRALGLKGEIILPSFTFIATAHSATWEQLQPRFVEISLETHCIDPEAAAAAISKKTAALLGVNLWGQACDIARLSKIANDAGIPLILDSAQALGCHIAHDSREQPTAGGALASVISLHATKVINSLEGGAILTNDEALADELRRMRNFGFVGYDNVVSLGTNAKLNEFSAAFAIRGLECLEGLIQHNAIIRQTYRESLRNLPGISFHSPQTSPTENHNYAVLIIDVADCPLSRDELMLTLWAENVLARRYFYPGCHRMEPYASRPERLQSCLPVTESVAASVLVMPASSAVSTEDVVLISQRIRQALQQHVEVRERLQASAAA